MTAPIVVGGLYQITRDIPSEGEPYFHKGEMVHIETIVDELPNYPGAIYIVRSSVTGNSHRLGQDAFVPLASEAPEFEPPSVAQAPYQHAVPPPSGYGPVQQPFVGAGAGVHPGGYADLPPKKKFPVWAIVLIVIAIVVIVPACVLLAIAVPTYKGSKSNAQKRTCQANLRTIEGAIYTYYADAEVYPDDISDMTSGQYQVLKSALQCPTNGRYYELEPGLPGEAPTVACPDSIEGHVI